MPRNLITPNGSTHEQQPELAPSANVPVEQRGMNRRNFLKILGIGGAAAVLPGCGSNSESAAEDEKLTNDEIIEERIRKAREKNEQLARDIRKANSPGKEIDPSTTGSGDPELDAFLDQARQAEEEIIREEGMQNSDAVTSNRDNGILWPPRLIDVLNTGALPAVDAVKIAHDSGASGNRGKMPNHNISTMHSGELTSLRDQLHQAKIELNGLTLKDNQYEMSVPMAKILWWIAQISRAVSGNMDLHNYLYSAAGVLLSHGIATPISGRQVPGMAHARKSIAKQLEQVTQTAERAIDMQIEHIDRKLGTTTNDV